MADSAKREKIAAARKKLKSFQKSSKGTKGKSNNTGAAKGKEENKKDKINNDLTQTEKIENASLASSLVNDGAGDISEQNTSGENHSVPLQEMTSIDQDMQNHGETVADAPSNMDGTSPNVQSQSFPPQSPVFDHVRDRPSSSTESLHQLSRQINGILAESPVGFQVEGGHAEIIELETRNRELASLLAQHVQTNEQLVSQNQQIRQHAMMLQTQLERERTEHQQRYQLEVGPVKEQLQVHIQTIGILVAEKTELQSQLAQAQKIGEQRQGDLEDLTGRLKTSKQRVADLERTLANTSSSSQKLEMTSKESAKEIDRLKLELFKLNKSHEEAKQTISETRGKFKSKTSEYNSLQQRLSEVTQKLELAELYNHQLSNENQSGTETMNLLHQLQQERDNLTSQVNQYSEAVRQLTVEKDQQSDQYKQYMEQYSNQISQLTGQVTSLTEEREKLVNQNHDMEGAVIELQRKLEDISNASSGVDDAAHADLLKELDTLHSEQADLSARHEAQIRDNAQLSRYLEEREAKIDELEARLEEMGEVAGDKAELLENIQSDKTALSRALTQNKDLKQQLAELQNGFVKMSNDNMELLNQLQSEQHTLRDLQVRLNTQEDTLTSLQQELSNKDTELVKAIENSVEANKVKLLHEQIQDRLRHYEAQAQLVETLQKELHSSQDIVDALTTQNSELRTMLIRATETKVLNPDMDVENAQRDSVISSLQSTIQQLESERNRLMESLAKQRDLTDHLGVKVSDLEEEVVQNNASNPDSDRVSRNDFDKLKHAMEMIQDKYNRVMRDKADLSDKADELEHMVLQLQGETETIGEYISLYHHQRALLQQRELQKNDYIKQLALDREELQDKLGELQTLVMQLMGEKHMLHSYQQESERPVSPNIHPPVKRHQHTDWPDYTSSESDTESEVETIVGGKDDVPMSHEETNERSHTDATPTENMNVSQESMVSHTVNDVNNHAHNFSERVDNLKHSKNEVKEDMTAHKILNLLSEIGHSSFVDNMTFLEKQFHPCKYCKGRLQIL
ncbi:golgin subfamily A member 2-like [Mya arenaria]|uniref:golgin subfamily A member 2-like n=1 Tax=Mya arenaria TaxID=6604 RepID=UPI0022E66CD1|nr:golgin subfamily A member 2-like [Mya arenaria]